MKDLNPDFVMDGEIFEACMTSSDKLPDFEECVKTKAAEKFSPE